MVAFIFYPRTLLCLMLECHTVRTYRLHVLEVTFEISHSIISTFSKMSDFNLTIFSFPFRWKEQLLHVLRSNPVQFVLCALVLIDAVIVIAEIILEIHSEKSRSLTWRNDRNHTVISLKSRMRRTACVCSLQNYLQNIFGMK